MTSYIELDEACVSIGIFMEAFDTPSGELSIDTADRKINIIPQVSKDGSNSGLKSELKSELKPELKSELKPPSKIPTTVLEELEALLVKIRINPNGLNDILFTNKLDDREVRLCNDTGDASKFMTTFSKYGMSKTRRTKLTPFGYGVLAKTGSLYGQDYTIADKGTIVLADGHGSESERLSHCVSEKLYEKINKIDFNKLLGDEEFKSVELAVEKVFSTIDKELELLYDSGNSFDSVRGIHSINRGAGTTCNISKIVNVTTAEGRCKRYIVSANLGDSETTVILRNSDKTYKLITLSGDHSAENEFEAKRLYKHNTNKYDILQPIYSRFGVHDTVGNEISPIPPLLKTHLDGSYIHNLRYPIFSIKDNSPVIDRELQHKMLMGAGKYGDLYNIPEWCGGVQSIRRFTIERINEAGEWRSFMPIPNCDYVNMGSSMGGNNQCSRGFEGNRLFNDAVPYVSIMEIPHDNHATIVMCSDGYGDIMYWSEVAAAISKTAYNSNKPDNSETIKSHLVNLMMDNIKDKEAQGINLKQNAEGGYNTEWDDVSFGILDSPPLI